MPPEQFRGLFHDKAMENRQAPELAIGEFSQGRLVYTGLQQITGEGPGWLWNKVRLFENRLNFPALASVNNRQMHACCI